MENRVTGSSGRRVIEQAKKKRRKFARKTKKLKISTAEGAKEAQRKEFGRPAEPDSGEIVKMTTGMGCKALGYKVFC